MNPNDDEIKAKEEAAKKASAEAAGPAVAEEQGEQERLNTGLGDQLPDFERLRKLGEVQETISAAAAEPETKPEPEATSAPTAVAQPAATPEPGAAKPEAQPEAKTDIAKASEEVERLRKELRSRDGKHGAEVENLRKQLDATTSQLEELRQAKVIETFAGDPNAEPTEEQLKEIYGDDFKDQMGMAYAIRDFKAKLKMDVRFLIRVEKLMDEKLRNIRQQTAEERALTDIERAVPGFGQLNQDADVNGFAAFLDGDFNGTGIPRREVANRAYAALLNGATGTDYERALGRLTSICKEFSAPASPDAVQPKPNETGAAPSRGKPDKDLYVQPAASRADEVPTGAKFTRAQLSAKLAAAKPEDFQKVMEWTLKQARLGNVID